MDHLLYRASGSSEEPLEPTGALLHYRSFEFLPCQAFFLRIIQFGLLDLENGGWLARTSRYTSIYCKTCYARGFLNSVPRQYRWDPRRVVQKMFNVLL